MLWHVAALLTAGLDLGEALVSFAAVGAAREEVFASRGWSERAWAAARERLAARGGADGSGEATAVGREGRAQVERLTDRLAVPPWRAMGPLRTGWPARCCR
ncbi:hypothetical protein BA062_08365 [Prauserella flavalba]|uniref:Uncharacterized protein n=1 Tax=Prauserella flavalba TaxID=1477506 RepID=A0A318LLQ0_9PSEU|nr:hypothetical protein [Prauserella flavalba]PXY35522.1 hypothetical protein BA062_08365 [Prauserella flavalba]